jgi:hypothetical protein
MKPTRRNLLILGALCAAVPAEAQQKVNVRLAVAPTVSVRLNGPFADLRVIGTDTDSLILTGTLPAGARLDAMSPPRGTPPATGAKFYIDAPQAEAAGGQLELRVPAGATVWAKSGSARIEVSGIRGGLDLNVVGGSISVSGTPRELNVESMDGDVDVTGTPGWMRVKTATGNVTVRGAGTDAGVTTVAGTVKLAGGPFERVRIETVTGSVAFGGVLGRAASLVIDSHSGGIDLRLDPKASVEIDATTITGTITNSVSARRPTPGREGRGAELALGVGTGDARVTLRSFKGNIRLLR